MKKIILMAGVPALLAILVWHGYHTVSQQAPAATSRAPQSAEQYHQAWRSWDEQVSDIKRQYGLDQPAARVIDDANTTGAESHATAAMTATTPATTPTAAALPEAATETSSPRQPDETATQNSAFERSAEAFWQESVDEIWAQQSGQQIADYFAEIGVDDGAMSVLNNVECRSSRCKVEVVHDDQQAVEEFELAFPIRMADSLHSITYQTDVRQDGRIAVVMYLEQ